MNARAQKIYWVVVLRTLYLFVIMYRTNWQTFTSSSYSSTTYISLVFLVNLTDIPEHLLLGYTTSTDSYNTIFWHVSHMIIPLPSNQYPFPTSLTISLLPYVYMVHPINTLDYC